MKEKPYELTAGSLLPADFCSRVYNHLKINRAQKGKPTHFAFPLRVERGAYLKKADLTRKFGQLITGSETAAFCIGINGPHLEAYIEFPGDEETRQGDRILDKVPLSTFASGKAFLLAESKNVDLQPKSLRRGLGAASGTAGLLGWVANITEFIPTVGEVATIIGVSAAAFGAVTVKQYCRIGLESEDGRTYLVAEMHQTGWYLMDALLHAPDRDAVLHAADAQVEAVVHATP